MQIEDLFSKPPDLSFMVMQLGCEVLHMHALQQPGLPWVILCSLSLGVKSLSNVAQCASKVSLVGVSFVLRWRLGFNMLGDPLLLGSDCASVI